MGAKELSLKSSIEQMCMAYTSSVCNRNDFSVRYILKLCLYFTPYTQHYSFAVLFINGTTTYEYLVAYDQHPFPPLPLTGLVAKQSRCALIRPGSYQAYISMKQPDKDNGYL